MMNDRVGPGRKTRGWEIVVQLRTPHGTYISQRMEVASIALDLNREGPYPVLGDHILRAGNGVLQALHRHITKAKPE